ncbi:MAG: ornithine carbamoyltransferase [Pseudomonadota bacterium]
MAPTHFLDIADYSTDALRTLISRAHKLKTEGRVATSADDACSAAVLAMIFEKPSTRTRLSFDVGMRRLGGSTITLNPQDLQLGRGETVEDTARVLSRYVDVIVVRNSDHDALGRLADAASIPVINGLTNLSHPCQVMADVLTYEEARGPIQGATIAWVGDANNVLTSWVHAAARFDFKIKLAAPKAYGPSDELCAWIAGEPHGALEQVADAAAACADADCVVTDTWVSMGDEDAEERCARLQDYQVTVALMAGAKPDAIFMHCLPAYRGKEVTAEVIDGPQSRVWDEAENRLHAQMAILEHCLAAQARG